MYDCQRVEEARRDAERFLYANMPSWDLSNNGTLAGGILPLTVNLSLAARRHFSWAADVPHDIWRDYVLPYASVNEARTDWRQLLTSILSPLLQNKTSQPQDIGQVVATVNRLLWLAVRPQGPIVFKSAQTPLIYDPMSTITFGYASCTGVSILLVDALRAVGVAARLVGTPAWHGKVSAGNHNWVEVWLGPGRGLAGEDWSFVEAQPAGPGESLDNPCDKWFCNPLHFDSKTETFAARFRRQQNMTVFPMAWDAQNREVPGVDRSTFYNKLCGSCQALRPTGYRIEHI